MRSLLFAPVLLLAATDPVQYYVKPAATNQFTLEVTKTGLMSGKVHLLEFGKYEGRIRFDAQTPAHSTVEFDVDAANVIVRDTWVSEKDRKKIHDYAVNDMLQSTAHPKISFRSTSAESAGDAVKVSGNLTIRGQTKPVIVTVKLKQSGDGFLVFEGHAEFRMTIFGLKPPSAAFGTIGTKDLMQLKFVLRAEK